LPATPKQNTPPSACVTAFSSEDEPDIRRQIERGDIAWARKRMAELGMNPRYQTVMVQSVRNPQISRRLLREFRRTATPEERERYERARRGSP
jgi:hypothetical protein